MSEHNAISTEIRSKLVQQEVVISMKQGTTTNHTQPVLENIKTARRIPIVFSPREAGPCALEFIVGQS